MKEENINMDEMENLFFPPLHKKLEKFFLQYLRNFNQNTEIIELAKQINYEMIIEIYEQEFTKLWNKYEMSDNIKLNQNKENFYIYVYENILHSICYFLFWSLKNDALKHFNKDIKYFGYVFAKFLSPFYFQLRLDENDKELYKELAECGKKFHGKSFKNVEAELFESVIQKYNEIVKKGEKRSFRSIAYNVYRAILEHREDDTFTKFYKRFNYYKNK